MTRWNDGSDQSASVSQDIMDESNALPAKYFIDPEVYEEEKESIFSENWIYAGHANNIPEPGDYFTREVGGKQVIVVRDSDGSINAFYNVCAHRGSKIVDDASEIDDTRVSRIQCPYHLWTYDLDGRLRSTPRSFEHADLNPDLEDDQVQRFDSEENGLAPAHVDTVGPFVFVNHASDPLSIEETVGSMKDELEQLPLGDYQHASRVTTEIACNWKVFGANYSECDHCQANHQDWIKGISLDRSELEVNEYHWVLHYTHDESVEADDALIEGEARFYYLWPNFTVNLYGTADGYGTYLVEPIDHETIRLVADYYFRDSELTEEEEEFIDMSVQLQEEDAELVERQYEGLQNGVLAQGQLGPNEHTVHRLHQLAQEAYNA
jgi:phenylpropionate dioxygenase-like ring-hydroxylating dioxygenase large terminal subunit